MFSSQFDEYTVCVYIYTDWPLYYVHLAITGLDPFLPSELP